MRGSSLGFWVVAVLCSSMLGLMTVGCSDSDNPSPGLTLPDAGGGAWADIGFGGSDVVVGADTALPDAFQPDAVQADAAQPDTSQPDAGQPDAAQPDSGVGDAGPDDSGAADAGADDGGPVDAGPSTCVGAADCGVGQACVGGVCTNLVCTPGDALCKDDKTREVCNADGTGFDDEPCVGDDVCKAGICAGVDDKICTPGAAACKQGQLQICNQDGKAFTAKPCEVAGSACLVSTCPPGGDACVQTPLDCDDGKACTTDTCDGGACAHAPAPVGTPCDDGNGCTVDETCVDDGSCAGGKENLCDDGNPCTDDACSAATGACAHTPQTGTPCNDGDLCKPGAVCVAGQCDLAGGIVSTLAGGGGFSAKDGPFADAVFGEPAGMALAQADGKTLVYLADAGARTIRQLELATQMVSTVAGSGSWGSTDGPAMSASFSSPRAVALAADGTLYIADEGNDAIRKLAGGEVSTVAGWADGIDGPRDLALDGSGNLWVANAGKHQIVRLDAVATFDAASADAVVVAGNEFGLSGMTDGQGTDARFSNPGGLCFGSDGALYVADKGNHRIRRVTTSGAVTTLAGGSLGFADGQGGAAKFHGPAAVRPGPGGTLLVADDDNRRLRQVALDGTVGTLAGSGSYGDDNGPASAASFAGPTAVLQVSDGQVLVGDGTNKDIRALTLAQVVCGDPSNPCGPEVCDAATGACVLGQPPVGQACDDGDPCTNNTACDAQGACSGGQAKTCDDGEPCTADACDAVFGCTHTPTGAPGCGEVAVFSDDFEAGAGAWTISSPGSTTAVGWQVVSFAAPAWSQSPSSALYYGQLSAADAPGSYPGDTSGAAQSKPVLVPGGAPKLSFGLYADVESLTSYDRIEWWVVDVQAGTEAKVWDKASQGFATQVWKTYTVDLSPYAGKAVQLEVRFDSVDSSSNTGKGVFIDDVAVAGT